MRRAARTDSNQTEVVKALRAVGARVVSLAQVGGGVPDLLVRYRGLWHVLEVKDGKRVPSKRKLTAAQEDFHQEFEGVVVVKDVDEALVAIGARAGEWRKALGDV